MFDDDDTVFARQADEQLACFGGFLVGHAGGRLVHEQQPGALGEQHADLQPFFWPCASAPAFQPVLSARPTVSRISRMRSHCAGVVRAKSVANTPRLPSRESRMFSKTVWS